MDFPWKCWGFWTRNWVPGCPDTEWLLSADITRQGWSRLRFVSEWGRPQNSESSGGFSPDIEMADQRPRLQRHLLEGVTIVASILLAFGVDAWWDEYQEGAAVERQLLTLATDMETNRQALGSVQARGEASLALAEGEACERLLLRGP